MRSRSTIGRSAGKRFRTFTQRVVRGSARARSRQAGPRRPRCRPRSMAWVLQRSMGFSTLWVASMPTWRVALGVTVINGILYAVGGGDVTELATVEAYDPTTDTWTSKASMPTKREGLGVTAINSILYAVGGDQNASGGTVLATVEAYDPSTDSWTTKASMPTARWGLGVAAINGVLYAIGGVNNGIRTEVEAYSP